MALPLRIFVSALAAASLVAAQGAGGLPQCVKGEVGCSEAADKPPAVFGSSHGVFGATVALHRYQPGDDGEYCGGKKLGYMTTVRKGQCVTFDEEPIEEMSLNYRLPNNKYLNHCDLTMFDGKECRGEVVWGVEGATHAQMVNGQRYCHKTPWAKSVYMGPCT